MKKAGYQFPENQQTRPPKSKQKKKPSQILTGTGTVTDLNCLEPRNNGQTITTGSEFEPGSGTKLKWGTIIPMIGGSAIGCFKSAGTKPAFHLTYKKFKDNESHLKTYWPEVPVYCLDKDQEPKQEDIEGKHFKRESLFKNLDNIVPSKCKWEHPYIILLTMSDCSLQNHESENCFTIFLRT